MKINFIFVRHGYGCHNAIGPLYKNNILKEKYSNAFYGKVSSNKEQNENLFIDPELTQIGVDASAYNGCIVSKTIRKIGFQEFENDEFKSINIVGSSPLIRSMETAYEMTKLWNVKPNKIFVFPHLREIDESSSDKYSKQSRKRMDLEPSYAMKSIYEQKKYLKSVNLDNIIDFKYVENYLPIRSEPGDVIDFIKWFKYNILPNIEPINILNVFVVTHAGVLRDFVEKYIGENENSGFYNNTGFIVSFKEKENDTNVPKMLTMDKYIPLNKYLPKTFFKTYSDDKYADSEYYCPSNRCSKFCKFIKHDPNKKINKIDLPTCSNTIEDNLSLISKLNIKNNK